ncbi:MAG TPA: polysaccharide pyruvyl transferase family protein [Haliangiales bacterium]|nr:polysaccharide pyruvyl transferase family protein [Haliangiales bacterium]
MTRIGFLGAFSIDNAGDAIVGYAGRQALRALLPDAEQTVFAPAFPHPFWGHAWDRERGIDAEIVPVPAGVAMDWARGVDALVIGGGGIVNLDPAFRPFLLGRPEEWDAARPAAWNAVCSQNQPWYAGEHAEAYEAVRRCCEKLRYVSVRNRTTVTFVRRCGFDGEIHVVPDPALLLAVPGEVDAAVDRLLAEIGADAARPLIGVSLGPAVDDARAAGFFRDVFASLRSPVDDGQVVVFPFSHVNGDDRIVEAVAGALPGALVVRRRLRALEVWRLIGRMAFYIGCRYHAMLAAFAQNVPFVVLDEYLSDRMASSKTREFVADLGLEPHYLCPYLPGSPSWKIEEVVRARESVSFAGRLEQLRARLRAHYTRMVAALGLI